MVGLSWEGGRGGFVGVLQSGLAGTSGRQRIVQLGLGCSWLHLVVVQLGLAVYLVVLMLIWAHK